MQFPDVVLQSTEPSPNVGLEEISDLQPAATRAIWFAAGLIAVTVVGWYVVEPSVGRIVRRRNENNPTIREAISRYLRLLFVVIGLFVGAGFAGYGQLLSDSALVIAAATLAIGVAGQAIIGSIVSGLALVVDPEFNIGNYIEWDGGEGEISSITLRVTRVRTPDGGLMTIPNTVLTNKAVSRPYQGEKQRVIERIQIPYEDDVEEALDQLTQAAQDIDGVLGTPQPKAYVDELGGNAVVVRVHYHVDEPRQRGVFSIRSEYAKRAMERLENAGVGISPASKRELQGRIEVSEPM